MHFVLDFRSSSPVVAGQLLTYYNDANYCNASGHAPTDTRATQALAAAYATTLEYPSMHCDYNNPPSAPPLYSPDCRVGQSALKSKRRAVTSSMTSSPASTNQSNVVTSCSYYKKLQARSCYDVSYDVAAVTSASALADRAYTIV